MQNNLFGLKNKKYWMVSYIYSYFWVRVKYDLAIFLFKFLEIRPLIYIFKEFCANNIDILKATPSANLKVNITFCMTSDSMTSLPCASCEISPVSFEHSTWAVLYQRAISQPKRQQSSPRPVRKSVAILNNDTGSKRTNHARVIPRRPTEVNDWVAFVAYVLGTHME